MIAFMNWSGVETSRPLPCTHGMVRWANQLRDGKKEIEFVDVLPQPQFCCVSMGSGEGMISVCLHPQGSWCTREPLAVCLPLTH